MIKQLSDYRTATTPFLNRVLLTGSPAFRGVGQMGYGPELHVLGGEEEKAAEAGEFALVSSSIDSWIRGRLYLHACEFGFRAPDGCACELIPQSEQLYPLRADAAGVPVNPMIVKDRSAVLNPVWVVAPKEFFFSVSQDVIKLDGQVSRAYQKNRFYFKFELALHIPQGSICVELKDRTSNESN